MKFVVGLMALAITAAACTSAGASPATSGAPSTPAGVSTPAASMSVMSSGAAPGGSVGPAVTAPADATAVKVLDFKILPAALTVKGTFSLFVTNAGPTVHNVTIRDASGKVMMATPDLRPGESAVLSGTLAPGTYVTFCSLPGHESLGTKGTLTVTA